MWRAPMADEARDYVIRKNGYFYRPEARGYCADVEAAGRWTHSDAIAYKNGAEGVSIHHLREFPSGAAPTPSGSCTCLCCRADKMNLLVGALEDIRRLLSYAENEAKSPAIKEGNCNAAWHRANSTLIDVGPTP